MTTNNAFIPVLHKSALKSLLKVIKLDSKIKINRQKQHEIFIMYEDEVWILDKDSKGFSYYKYNPSISIWASYENVIQFFTLYLARPKILADYVH